MADFFNRLFRRNDPDMQQDVTSVADLGIDVQAKVIDKKAIHKAQETLQKYKQGKANLEQRIVEAEQWYKLRHWECMRKSSTQEVEPVSGFLFNAIANKHADMMDNMPLANVLPRERGDEEEAKKLSSIIPVVLDQCDFERTYSRMCDRKLRAGTGVYGVFWDKSKHNGLGDINIRDINIINLFWESGVMDIQESRNVFHVELMDNDLLEAAYPQLTNKLSSSSVDIKTYIYDDSIDTTDKSAVVDWYYKKNVNGKDILHYVKYVNDEVLYATEDDPELAERGLYDHGMYPFHVDALYTTEGTIAGFGLVDLGKSPQEYIDRGNQAILKNMLVCTKPRYFVRSDGEINEEEFLDTNKDLVHVGGNLGQDSIIPIMGTGLGSIYVEVINGKIDELKEVTGNRDVSTGGTTGGVTAASGVAAMMEASSKLSRDITKASYWVFKQVVLMVIELIRQFYDIPRQFRILGENGKPEFVDYSNAGIRPQQQFGLHGEDMGYRVPEFDVEVAVQKQSPYSKMAQNELAIQFYNAGFFNPQLADQALACLEMMDFDRKQAIIDRVTQNGTMYQQMLMMQQQMLQLAQIVDATQGTGIAEQIAQGVLGGNAAPQIGGAMSAPKGDADAATSSGAGESSVTKNARERVADSTAPR